MFPLQRSIPFPPIRLERIERYLQFLVQRGSATIDELKHEQLDFGKGKGDITRFLERLGLVAVSGKTVTPTKTAYDLLTAHKLVGPAAFHPILRAALTQYRILVELIEERRSIKLEELHETLNKRLSEISPSGWVNNVAFKSLVAIAVDVGLAKKDGGFLIYVGDPIARALDERGAVIGGIAYVDDVPEWLKECTRPQKPLGIAQLDPECASRALERLVQIN